MMPETVVMVIVMMIVIMVIVSVMIVVVILMSVVVMIVVTVSDECQIGRTFSLVSVTACCVPSSPYTASFSRAQFRDI
jgi:hypothetical protein